MEEGFSNLSQIMRQEFSDLLSVINNLNRTKTNFVKDKNENLNLTHFLGKSLTESSKKIQIPTDRKQSSQLYKRRNKFKRSFSKKIQYHKKKFKLILKK